MFNYESDDWNIPLNFAFGKIEIIAGRPWKFAIELNTTWISRRVASR